MRRPEEFPAAITLSFKMMVAVYMTFSALCYYAFGSATQDNVLKNMAPSRLRDLAIVMVTAHVLFAFSIWLNPVFYLFEETLGIEIATGTALPMTMITASEERFDPPDGDRREAVMVRRGGDQLYCRPERDVHCFVVGARSGICPRVSTSRPSH